MTRDHAFGSGALEMLAHAVAELNQSVPGWIDSIDGDEIALLMLLQDLRTQRVALAEIEAFIESKAAAAMGDELAELPNGRGVAERKGGGWFYREWDHVTVSGRVVAAVLDDSTDEATAWRVRDELLTAARPAWRTSVLRKRGIDFSDCCTYEPGRRTVHITAPKEDQ